MNIKPSTANYNIIEDKNFYISKSEMPLTLEINDKGEPLYLKFAITDDENKEKNVIEEKVEGSGVTILLVNWEMGRQTKLTKPLPFAIIGGKEIFILVNLERNNNDLFRINVTFLERK